LAKEFVLRNAFDATKFSWKKATGDLAGPAGGFEKKTAVSKHQFFFFASLVLEFGEIGPPYRLPSRMY